jgi:exopolysaccharide biosynthesis protein
MPGHIALRKQFARNLCAVSLLAITASAQAEWKVLSTESKSGLAGIEHRHVVVEDAPAGHRADFDVAIFSAKSCALRIIDNPEGESLSAMMKLEKCLCGVNGGYFDTEFKPIGLRISDDRNFSPLRREFSHTKKIVAAIQAGPFLVEASKNIRGLNDSQLARRTFAGIASNNRGLLGVCSGISLAELAKILATVSFDADCKVRRAMNLDGGSSSAFWFARENGSAFSIPGQKPVRDFVGIVAR